MDVSIITIHDPDVNYGSTLQSCATYNYIKQLGYDAQIIDYKPQYLNLKKRIKKELPKLLFLKEAAIRRRKINHYFEHYATLTRRYSTKEDLFSNPPESKVYITGSDVIWNKHVNSEGGDPSFYLSFVNKGIKMSFSPSMGELQPEESVSEIAEKISDFKYISVREEASRKQLVQAGLNNVFCTMDPVFLHDKDYYVKQVGNNKYGKYTLVYLMSDTVEKRQTVSKLASIYGNQTVAFGGFRKKSDCDVFIRNAGVEDFLSLIYYADRIITDSFHCISFSLIFNKQFVYLPSIDSSLRIENLLDYAHLEKRILKGSDSDLSGLAESDIDYSLVNEALQKHICDTRAYLKNALENSI